ncbi:probable purple acid phosphatase 20, partial [Tanacetum coccineum]
FIYRWLEKIECESHGLPLNLHRQWYTLVHLVGNTKIQLLEPLATSQPTPMDGDTGDHDAEKIPATDINLFTAYNARWHMPYENSSSFSNLYYSFEVSKVHVIMLSSYTDFGPRSDQYYWLKYDLLKVNRTITPWLIMVIHALWYSTNYAHKGEKESVGMRKSMERLLYKAHVDMIFAGHIDAYERFNRVYNHKITVAWCISQLGVEATAKALLTCGQ